MTGSKQPIAMSIATSISNLPPKEHMTAPRETLYIKHWDDPIECAIEEPKHFDSIESKPIPRRCERKSYIRRNK